jgi:hypothetical protein
LPQGFGAWEIRGRVICHDTGPPFAQKGCGAARKISANCYQFHLLDTVPNKAFDESNFRPRIAWHSRGWRQHEPPTCHEHPTV